MFLSNFIPSSIMFPFSVSDGRSGVVSFNFNFGFNVTGAPMSMISSNDRSLTNAVIAENSCPCGFLSASNVSLVQLSEWRSLSSHLHCTTCFSSSMWFTHIFEGQNFAKRPGFTHFAQFLPLTGHYSCLGLCICYKAFL